MRPTCILALLCSALLACDTAETTCDEITTGSGWAWSGPCLGMTMACEVEKDGCNYTITCTGMEMGLPETATVDGSSITFEDGAEIRGCRGTVEDADTLSGTCDGACTWTLERS